MSQPGQTITLPYNWKPRDYQMPVWEALEQGYKRVIMLWHRRAGKDLTAINWCATQAFQRTGLYWHLFPTYSQGRKVIWEGADKGGRPFLTAFPEGTWYRKRDDDMTLWLHGGSRYQVVGTDHIDRLMGSNPIGVIVSEYALQNPAAWELIRPILAENEGWAVFPYTPRGRNHGYQLYKNALDNPNWFVSKLSVDDTNAIPMEAIEEDRASGMPEEKVQQEYWCSFNAALVGAYYGQQLSWMREQEPPRINDEVVWVPDKEVVTGWDLGYGDATAIWFAQIVRGELRLIDYYQASGEPIDHYVKVMRDKPYVYGDAYLPHDAAAKTLQTGKSVQDQLHNLGVRCIVNPKLGKEDKIAAVRLALRTTWINESKCDTGLNALAEYVKKQDPNQRGPDNEIIYMDAPLRNWATHGADALAELVIGFRPDEKREFKQPTTKYVV